MNKVRVVAAKRFGHWHLGNLGQIIRSFVHLHMIGMFARRLSAYSSRSRDITEIFTVEILGEIEPVSNCLLWKQPDAWATISSISWTYCPAHFRMIRPLTNHFFCINGIEKTYIKWFMTIYGRFFLKRELVFSKSLSLVDVTETRWRHY